MISVVVAMADGGVIGVENRLPWHLSADLRHFKSVTMGKPIVMGRRTHESIGRPLPGRNNIVLSRDQRFRATGCVVAASVEAALHAAGDVPEIMVVGGEALYRTLLPRAGQIYLTRVHAGFAGDTFFPALNPTCWQEVERQDHQPDARNPYPYSFLRLLRCQKDE